MIWELHYIYKWSSYESIPIDSIDRAIKTSWSLDSITEAQKKGAIIEETSLLLCWFNDRLNSNSLNWLPICHFVARRIIALLWGNIKSSWSIVEYHTLGNNLVTATWSYYWKWISGTKPIRWTWKCWSFTEEWRKKLQTVCDKYSITNL
jgi:hypothetical protein